MVEKLKQNSCEGLILEKDLLDLKKDSTNFRKFENIVCSGNDTYKLAINNLTGSYENISDQEKQVYKNILVKSLSKLVGNINSGEDLNSSIVALKLLAVYGLGVKIHDMGGINGNKEFNTQKVLNIFNALSNFGEVKNITNGIIEFDNNIMRIDTHIMDFDWNYDISKLESGIGDISGIGRGGVIIGEKGFYDIKSNGNLVEGLYENYGLGKIIEKKGDLLKFEQGDMFVYNDGEHVANLGDLSIGEISKVEKGGDFLWISGSDGVALYGLKDNRVIIQEKDLGVGNIESFSGHTNYFLNGGGFAGGNGFVVGSQGILSINLRHGGENRKIDGYKSQIGDIVGIEGKYVIGNKGLIRIGNDGDIINQIDFSKEGIGNVKSYRLGEYQTFNSSRYGQSLLTKSYVSQIIGTHGIALLKNNGEIENKIVLDEKTFGKFKFFNEELGLIIGEKNTIKVNPLNLEIENNTESISQQQISQLNELGINDLNRFHSNELVNHIIGNRKNLDKLGDKPVVVLFEPEFDHNQSFSQNKHHELIEKYDVLYYEIGSENELLEALSQINDLKQSKGINIEMVQLGSHSNQFEMQFSGKFSLDMNFATSLGDYRNLFDEKTLFVVRGCEAGRGGDKTDNIAKRLFNSIGQNAGYRFSSQNPSRTVYNVSIDGNIIPNSIGSETYEKGNSIYIK